MGKMDRANFETTLFNYWLPDERIPAQTLLISLGTSLFRDWKLYTVKWRETEMYSTKSGCRLSVWTGRRITWRQQLFHFRTAETSRMGWKERVMMRPLEIMCQFEVHMHPWDYAHHSPGSTKRKRPPSSCEHRRNVRGTYIKDKESD